MRKSVASVKPTPGRPTVLIATVDAEIQEVPADLLERTSVNAIWVGRVEAVKTLVATESISACICGFWLQDGSYREVIRHLRRERMDIHTIIVSVPACPQEYRDYLAAMNLGALDFLCYPYEKPDFERSLESAIAAHSRSTGRQQDPKNGVDFRERGAA